MSMLPKKNLFGTISAAPHTGEGKWIYPQTPCQNHVENAVENFFEKLQKKYLTSAFPLLIFATEIITDDNINDDTQTTQRRTKSR
ncbi:MAG: hypothetical protein KatS3mg038_2903 [Candidatus Kapaibacterium sp.]|nr:MAG: hypothetical protein KatS3mg038_1173 [Candidatus Kapabacteria bacterium]GIV52382.1 MAG: hypothetical protein KatS3mg038_2903 [Candidatus Kapabacteria bacterium]